MAAWGSLAGPSWVDQESEQAAVEAASLAAADRVRRGARGSAPFDTRLLPDQEAAFQTWKGLHAPQDSGADYDLRGAFKAGVMPDPASGHWPDTFKKPNHPTFSVESQYAAGRPAGRWDGETFIPPAAVPFGSLAPASTRREGGITRGLDHLGVSVYNTLAKPSRIWGALAEVPMGQPLSERPDIVDAVAQTATDIIGLPGIMGGAPATLASGAIRRTPGLPMDEASRMARAKELGFNVDEPLFHGTGKAFGAFDPGMAGRGSGSAGERAAFFSPSGETASHYSRTASIRDARPGETPHELWDYGGKDYRSVYDGAQVYPSVVKPGRQKEVDKPYYNSGEMAAELAAAERGGYDTIRFKNMVDSGQGGQRMDQVAVLNPANVRSKFAAFDPANKDSGFLLGANSTDKKTGAAIVAGQHAGDQPFGSLAPDGIRAYHGSPHDFDKFDVSRIGTGEGAQAYGHGLYFAENEKVAKEYRDANLSATMPPRRVLFGQELVPGSPEYHAGTLLSTMGKSVPQVRKEVQGWITNARPGEDIGHYQQVMATLDRIGGKRDFSVLPPRGKMYEVNINAKPEQFLDWDRPLSQQRPEVQSVAMKHLYGDPSKLTGEDAYRGVKAIYDRHDDASKLFRDEGLPGIKYHDQGSRNVPTLQNRLNILRGDLEYAERRGIGDADAMRRQIASLENQLSRKRATSNYVLFDDSLVDILRKYAMPGAVGSGAAWGSMAPGGDQ